MRESDTTKASDPKAKGTGELGPLPLFLWNSKTRGLGNMAVRMLSVQRPPRILGSAGAGVAPPSGVHFTVPQAVPPRPHWGSGSPLAEEGVALVQHQWVTGLCLAGSSMGENPSPSLGRRLWKAPSRLPLPSLFQTLLLL